MKMRSLHFNGKFYAGNLNGVHRVADRLIREVDALLAGQNPDMAPIATLYVPVRRKWQPQLSAIRIVEEAGAHSQLWEQRVLPRRAAEGVLVNLCNLAPIAHRRQITMIHDAQFLFPDSSYPARQRIGYRLLVPLMARRSAQVLTVSDYSRQMLDVMGVSARERTRVLYNGADHIREAAADPGIVDRLGLGSSQYVLIFGSAKRYKNVQIVFDAFADGALAPLKLVVIGPSESELLRSGMTVPAGTVFAGKADDTGLRSLYEQALCVAFPSRTEGFGLPPVEAMMCDCPAIVSPAGAIPEICRDTVFYADIDDIAGWRDAIRRCSSDPELREQKVIAGRARSARFTWRAAGTELLEIVTELASRP